MKPAEVDFRFEQFKAEISSLANDALVDRWIAFDGSAESKEPDLGMLKACAIEAAMVSQFGLLEWQDVVKRRKDDLANANRA